MACPWCGAKLEGLGKFCHACNRYTDQPQGERPAVQTELLRAPNEQEAEHAPATGGRPSTAVLGPVERAGRQVLVLPLISQNRMWGVKAFIAKVKMIEAATRNDWRGMMKAVHGAMHVTHEGEKYREQAATWLAAQGAYRMEGEVRVLMTLYLERRGSDTDNYIKPTGDVLQGPVLENDKQIAEWHVVRRYDKTYPRAVVVLESDDGSIQLDPGATFRYEQEF